MQLGELPRDGTGQIQGRYRLRHVRPDFCASLGYANFVNGVTTAPIEGYPLGRVMAGLGSDVSAEPWESEAEAPTHPAGATASSESTEAPALTSMVTPTTWAEVEAMNETAVRAAAADLGCTDKRMGVPRLRRFLADQLGIEAPEQTHGA